MRERIRLDKILAHMGYGTRKEIKALIRKGAVTVDGREVRDSGFQVNPYASEILVGGERVLFRQFVYLMMNKPQGVISATGDLRHKTVVDLLDPRYAFFRVFPVGRLDKDTEGLLLLTNDGRLAHDLLAPRKHIPKTYYARVEGEVTEEDGRKFREGVVLDDGYRTLPASLEILRAGETSEVRLTICEGKFHQVKRMFASVGKKVAYLKRIAMGGLSLDPGLSPGEYRELTEEELTKLTGGLRQ